MKVKALRAKERRVCHDVKGRRFGATAIERCAKYGKRYDIKEDLAEHLDGIEFTRTDTRKAEP